MKLIFCKLSLYSSQRISARSDINIFALRNVDPMWEYLVSCVSWCLLRCELGHIFLCISPQPAAPIYSSVFPPWKFWRQENKRYYSATGGPAPTSPSSPHNYLRPSVYTVQQQILSNNSSQLPTHKLSHPSYPPACQSSHRTWRGTIIKYFGGW